MDAFLAHAIVDPLGVGSGDTPEARAARAMSLQVLGLAAERALSRTWRARTQDGKQVGLVVVVDAATEVERDRFALEAERLCAAGAIEGVLRVHAVAPSRDAFVVDLWTTGCATDLPALHWPTRRRLEFVRRVTQSLDALHRAGFVHGCLCPDNVLLDDDLQPVLAEAGLVSVHSLLARRADASSYSAFVAPEVKAGGAPDVFSDLWSAGRLLEQLVGDRDVPQVAEIVSRCVAPLAHVRFSSAAELAASIDQVIATLPKGDRGNRPATSPLPDLPRERHSATSGSKQGVVARARPPEWTLWPAVVGITAMALALGSAFLLGVQTDAARVLSASLLAAGVAITTWAVRPLPDATSRKRLAVRLALASSCAMLVVALDPLSGVLRAGALSRLRGSETARRAGVAELVELGRDFRGLSLTGLDLSGLDLTGADFRDADLSRADFSGARLWAARLERASLDGARLARANLEEATLDQALHPENAECDDATRLPQGWRCDSGKPTR